MPFCRIYTHTGECLKSFETKDYGSRIVIGRSSSCEISLKGLAENNVSREHIILKAGNGKWTIESVGHSGVYYNAERIDTMEMKDGDVFRFSQLFLCIGEKNGPSDYDLTWEAQTENNQHRAVIWPGVNSVGASRDNYITIRTEDVSRVHGKITCENGHLTYESIHISRAAEVNGVSVNGDKVEIKVGDELTLEETAVKVIKAVRVKQQAVVKRTATSDAVEVSHKKRRSFDAMVVMLIIACLVLLLVALFVCVAYGLLLS